jgi:hypothetical protein
MTAQPLRQDKYVIAKQDWRTYHRLIIYREIVLKEILGKAVRAFFFFFEYFFSKIIFIQLKSQQLFLIYIYIYIYIYILYCITIHTLNCIVYQANSKHPGEVKMDFVPAFASTLSMFDKMCDNGIII